MRGKRTGRTASVVQIAVGYAGLALIGLGVGLQGVAWPYIRADFGLPLDALGVLMVATTAGSVTSSFNGGLIASLVGVGPLLAFSSGASALGLVGYSVAPSWWVMVLAAMATGLGNGAMHVALNAHFAANHGLGVINWLHASFGLGATLGPLIMTAVLRADASWRWGYGAAALTMSCAALYFASTRSRWSGSTEKGLSETNERGVGSGLETLGLPIVWLSLVLFFSYTGVEATAGQWGYSLFTEARSIAGSTAGVWMTVYWGGMAVGRLVVGFVGDRFDEASLVRLCILCVTAGAGLIWWHPTDGLSFVGIALMGLAQGPIFPSLVSGTARRVQPGHVDHTIGFQVAAASLGAAAVSSAAGVVAERTTLEILGPFLVAWSTLTLLVHEAVRRRAQRIQA